MMGGYKDNVPKNIKFFNFDCCDLNKMNKIMKDIDVSLPLRGNSTRRVISFFTC